MFHIVSLRNKEIILRAQYSLARLYKHGVGIDKNFDLAISFYKKAANQGLKEAAEALGIIYEEGLPEMPDALRCLMTDYVGFSAQLEQPVQPEQSDYTFQPRPSSCAVL